MQTPLRQIVIRSADVPPSRDDLEVIGTFNPGAVKTSNGIVLLVRVAERPYPLRPGFTGLPRWETGRGNVIDWVANEALEWIDPRVVRCKADGLVRLTFTSYLKVFRSADGIQFVADGVSDFLPESPLEEFGVEDPRITPLDGRFYITYVAVSRHGVATALASTENFRSFTRHGVIFGPENKDVVLFPERIDGQYVALTRPSGGAGFARPEMWLAKSPDLIHWGQHQHLLGVGATWDSGRIGAGPPPLRVEEGWLVLYHGNRRPRGPGDVGEYSAGAMLLAHDDPRRILRRCAAPFLKPEAEFECEGFVPGVVFPTGVVADGPSLLIYYGAADTSSAVVRMSLDEILNTP
ncbi:MAG: glycoside hydrolase family 130 protein [Planctomycetes bacterium]|nr:glycoside hydrolase family 130 protein [Planctomycetota bacterium]